LFICSHQHPTGRAARCADLITCFTCRPLGRFKYFHTARGAMACRPLALMFTFNADSVVAQAEVGPCSGAGRRSTRVMRGYCYYPKKGRHTNRIHPSGRFDYFILREVPLRALIFYTACGSTLVMQLLCYLALHVRSGLLHASASQVLERLRVNLSRNTGCFRWIHVRICFLSQSLPPSKCLLAPEQRPKSTINVRMDRIVT